MGLAGSQFNSSNIGIFAEGFLESSRDIRLDNTNLSLAGTVVSTDRVVQSTTSNKNLALTNASNLILGSILTLKAGVSSDPNKRSIPQNTRLESVDQTTGVVTLSLAVKLEAGTEVTFTYTSNTDGTMRGESLNFTHVVHDGRKFVAVTGKGTIHTSVDGVTWTLSYADPAGVAYKGLIWTGEKLLAVGDQGRVLMSQNGYDWEFSGRYESNF
jgi:hypothetical protein